MAEVNGMRIAVLKRTATARVTGIVRGFQYQSEFTIPTQVEENGMTFRVTEIDDAAFKKCSALTSITIPEGIVRIGKLAFAECSSLTSITIPKTVTQIENGWVSIGENNYCGHLFTNCPCLTSIVVEEGNPRYKSIQNGNGIIDKTTNTLIAGDQTTIIPDSVTSIANYAFRSCNKLTSITIPNSVTSIGYSAFESCDKLTSVTIGNSANNIIGACLGASPSLTSINVDVNNPNYCSIDGVLFDKNQTTLISYPSSKQGAYIIPNSVTSIGDHAFYNCDALTSITIPNSVTSIGNGAFKGCNKLTSVTIPNSVTSIGEKAFSMCSALTSITIPNSVTSIGFWAFATCKALTSITIPNSVTSIGDYAFRGCDALTSVTIGNSVTSIGEDAFLYCNKLTSVTIENEEGNISIGKNAFPSSAKIKYVIKFKDLYFADSFKNSFCAKIVGVVEKFKNQSEFTIPTQFEKNGKTFRVTEIADAAFRNCSALTSITIPEGIVRIGKLAFAECSSLTSITIPKTVTQIESGRVDIGDTYYCGHLFTNCPSLTSIVVEEGNPKYKTTQNGNGIIDKKTNTLIAGDQTTSIPEDVINIGEYAFATCKALTSITIPNSVTSIGDNAFYSCDALTSVTIENEEGKVAIGADAFPSHTKINYHLTLLTKLLKLLKYFNKK